MLLSTQDQLLQLPEPLRDRSLPGYWWFFVGLLPRSGSGIGNVLHDDQLSFLQLIEERGNLVLKTWWGCREATLSPRRELIKRHRSFREPHPEDGPGLVHPEISRGVGMEDDGLTVRKPPCDIVLVDSELRWNTRASG